MTNLYSVGAALARKEKWNRTVSASNYRASLTLKLGKTSRGKVSLPSILFRGKPLGRVCGSLHTFYSRSDRLVHSEHIASLLIILPVASALITSRGTCAHRKENDSTCLEVHSCTRETVQACCMSQRWFIIQELCRKCGEMTRGGEPEEDGHDFNRTCIAGAIETTRRCHRHFIDKSTIRIIKRESWIVFELQREIALQP